MPEPTAYEKMSQTDSNRRTDFSTFCFWFLNRNKFFAGSVSNNQQKPSEQHKNLDFEPTKTNYSYLFIS